LVLKSRVIVVIPRLRKKVLASGLPQDFPGLKPKPRFFGLKIQSNRSNPEAKKKVLASGLPQDFSGLKPKP
jgi:hypothetical protein